MATKTKKLQDQVLDAVKKRDSDILRRFARGESKLRIAEAVGITRQRVTQIIKAHQTGG